MLHAVLKVVIQNLAVDGNCITLLYLMFKI
jgi:hypothetical protein